MGRGDETVKLLLETDMARVLDAMRAVSEIQEWSLDLARRRWRMADAEELGAHLQRVEGGLIVVHRWVGLLRRVLPQFIREHGLGDRGEPAKETSESAA